MPKHRLLLLSEEQQQELRQVREHDRLPYMRERAAALLKIAQGERPAHVARSGRLASARTGYDLSLDGSLLSAGSSGAAHAARPRAQARFFPLPVWAGSKPKSGCCIRCDKDRGSAALSAAAGS